MSTKEFTKKALETLRSELDVLKQRVDTLRVQGNLGKMELRDALDDLGGTIEPKYRAAKKTISEALDSGIEESKTLAKSVQAGWDELRRTYESMSRENDKKK